MTLEIRSKFKQLIYDLYFVARALPRNVRLKPEETLAVQVNAYLSQALLNSDLDCLYFHVPNEGYRSKYTGQKMRCMGLVSGVYDYVFIAGKFAGVIELKTPTRMAYSKLGKLMKRKQTNLNPNQILFGDLCDHFGVKKRTCRSLSEVISALSEWGVLNENRSRIDS